MLKYILGMLMFIGVAQADTILTLEQPTGDTFSQGVSNIRGWVATNEKVSRVQIFIDGEWVSDIPLGASRPDVEDKYPNMFSSGFSMAYYFGSLEREKDHTILVQALNLYGKLVGEDSSQFLIEKFEEDTWKKSSFTKYVSCETDEDFNGFILHDIFLNDNFYKDVKYEWNNSTQNYTIVGVPYVEANLSCDTPRFSPDPLADICDEDKPVIIVEED